MKRLNYTRVIENAREENGEKDKTLNFSFIIKNLIQEVHLWWI